MHLNHVFLQSYFLDKDINLNPLCRRLSCLLFLGRFGPHPTTQSPWCPSVVRQILRKQINSNNCETAPLNQHQRITTDWLPHWQACWCIFRIISWSLTAVNAAVTLFRALRRDSLWKTSSLLFQSWYSILVHAFRLHCYISPPHAIH